MLVLPDPPVHLTYCLNVHPGESWAENLDAIRRYAVGVRDRVACDGPFGLGLRLSARAADELHHPNALAEFRAFLDGEGLYVFTINGFPYGQFHAASVKEDVYRPDWRSPARRDYTVRLALLLAELLPEGVAGSISTVPLSYKPWIQSEVDLTRAIDMLSGAAELLADIRQRTGKDIRLALEPEPDCYLESTSEAVAFFTGRLRDRVDEGARRQIGLCFDTAHLAVGFEDPAESIARLAEAGGPIAKIHLSAALRLTLTPEALARLESFAEGVYLHQVKARRTDGTIHSFADLPEALAAKSDDWDEWRVHFHVPLFFATDGLLSSTADLLTGDFADALAAGATDHLEIETYTFDVLPADLRADDVTESIAREYQWVREMVL